MSNFCEDVDPTGKKYKMSAYSREVVRAQFIEPVSRNKVIMKITKLSMNIVEICLLTKF